MSTNTAISPESLALLDRVKQVKKTKKLTNKQIAETAGMYRPTVTNQTNGHYNLDVRVLMAISRLCPDVSCDWLLRGNGSMLISDHMSYARADMRDIIGRIEALENRLSNNEILTK